jgi:outer membrane protein assembly factor BamB
MKYRGHWQIIPRLIVLSISAFVFSGSPQPKGLEIAPEQGLFTQDAPAEWSQFGQNADHINFASRTIAGAVHFAWDWNSAGKDGKSQANHLHVADLVQPITGSNRIYMVTDNAIYALEEDKGGEVWKNGDIGTLNSTPVYRNNAVFIGSENGNLYKLDASSGDVIKSVDLGGAISTALVATDTAIVAATASGNLIAVDPETLATVWKYDAGIELVTMPAYSASHHTVVVVGKDLYVHAVDATTGKQKWRVKPTEREYTTETKDYHYAVAENGWPVIAEQHGLVFIRYRLEWNTLWALGEYPKTNAEIRAALIANPEQQALFALSLDTGKTAFLPAVGNGGQGDGGELSMGPLPVIRQVDGQEVAYMIWRNGQTCANCDGREDATMGEMVLDDTTVKGYAAGDMRFVQFDDIQTDEMMSLTMIGDILFHGHWLVDAGRRVVDRSDRRGDKFSNPITTTNGMYVIWRQCYCPAGSNCNPILYPGGSGTTSCNVDCPFNAKTRYCPTGLFSYGDQRGYPAGFYQYHNDIQHTKSLPFTVANDKMIIVKTGDGGLMAFTSGARTEETQPMTVANPVSRPDIFGPKIPKIGPKDAMQAIGKVVEVCGTIRSVVDHLPKAIYMSFTTVHDGQMMVRVFNKDLSKFDYDVKSLDQKDICVTGLMRLYYPELNAPEIIVEDSRQIVINTPK